MRLEDMDMLFGDATTAVPTPATQAERGSLMGVGSPATLDIRRAPGPGDAIPGLDIDPPKVHVENGKPRLAREASHDRGEGLGGWISRMVRRGNAAGDGARRGGPQYRALDQAEDE